LRWLIRRYRQRYLCVYPWGLFVLPDLTLPWERIQHLWRGWKESHSDLPPRIRLDAIRLQRDDGTTFAFSRARWNRRNTEQRTALCDRIERACLRVQLRGLLDQFDRGEWLCFGPLQVSRRGLVYLGWGEMAWEEIERFEVNETALQFQTKSTGPGSARVGRVDVPDLPNASLLRALAYARHLLREGDVSA
jgi:hypothetical protein